VIKFKEINPMTELPIKFRSPLKFEVLKLLSEGGKTSAEVAGLVGKKESHVTRYLRGYWSQGLLKREGESMRHGGVRYVYSLSESGRKRLDFFRSLL